MFKLRILAFTIYNIKDMMASTKYRIEQTEHILKTKKTAIQLKKLKAYSI